MTNDMPNLEDANTETHVQNVTKHAPVTNLKRNEPTKPLSQSCRTEHNLGLYPYPRALKESGTAAAWYVHA